MRKCLVVICHSRPVHLEKCLESFFSAHGSAGYRVVLVRQVGYPEVADVVTRFRDRLDLVIEVEGEESPAESIRRNRFLGYFAAYQTLNSELVLTLEDDVLISYDALDFIEQVMAIYDHRRDFRGINLGSIEPLHSDLIDTYSLLRYGLHGQASVLTSRSWRTLLRSPIVLVSPGGHFDAAIEAFLKTGFMVTPNSSRHLDFGYGGTHAPDDAETAYFAGLRRSWVGMEPRQLGPLVRRDLKHNWRDDAVIYHRWANPYYRFIVPLRPRVRRLVRAMWQPVE